jgi:hypothetical protein
LVLETEKGNIGGKSMDADKKAAALLEEMKELGVDLPDYYCVRTLIKNALEDALEQPAPVHLTSTTQGKPAGGPCYVLDLDTATAALRSRPRFKQLTKMLMVLRQHAALVLLTSHGEARRQEAVQWLRESDIWHDGLFMLNESEAVDSPTKVGLLKEIADLGWQPLTVICMDVAAGRIWSSCDVPVLVFQ